MKRAKRIYKRTFTGLQWLMMSPQERAQWRIYRRSIFSYNHDFRVLYR